MFNSSPLVTAVLLVTAGLMGETSAAAGAAAPAATMHRIPVVAQVTGTTAAHPSGHLIAFDARGTGTWKDHGFVTFEVIGTLDPRPTCKTFTGRETLRLVGKTRPIGSMSGTVHGYGCPREQDPSVLDVRAVNAVDKGSREFTGASGGWSVGGTFNLATGAFDHSLRGLVLVPGS